jgi:hypothetical protein
LWNDDDSVGVADDQVAGAMRTPAQAIGTLMSATLPRPGIKRCIPA